MCAFSDGNCSSVSRTLPLLSVYNSYEEGFCRKRENFYFSTNHAKHHSCLLYKTPIKRLKIADFIVSLLRSFCTIFVSSRGMPLLHAFVSLAQNNEQLREVLQDIRMVLQLCLLCKLFFCKRC